MSENELVRVASDHLYYLITEEGDEAAALALESDPQYEAVKGQVRVLREKLSRDYAHAKEARARMEALRLKTKAETLGCSVELVKVLESLSARVEELEDIVGRLKPESVYKN